MVGLWFRRWVRIFGDVAIGTTAAAATSTPAIGPKATSSVVITTIGTKLT